MEYFPGSLGLFACVICSQANSKNRESLGKKKFPATPQRKCCITAGQIRPSGLSLIPPTKTILSHCLAAQTPSCLLSNSFPAQPSPPHLSFPDPFPTMTLTLCPAEPLTWQNAP